MRLMAPARESLNPTCSRSCATSQRRLGRALLVADKAHSVQPGTTLGQLTAPTAATTSSREESLMTTTTTTTARTPNRPPPRPHPSCPTGCSRCSSGCVCPTCAPPPPTCWPPPGPTLGPRRSPPRAALEEIRGRDDATRRKRRKTAGFPTGKTFESWREADSSIPPGTQTGLATLEWVGRAENLAVAGPSGTGKTHFVEALAHAVIDAGMRVSWFTLETLTAAIGRATVDGSVAKTIARICRSELIVVDDIGMLPAGQDAGEAFYRVVDAAYERRSIAVTSPTCTPPGSTRSCPRPWPPRPSTGSCTTPTSCSPKAPHCDSPKPPPDEE